MIHDSAVLLPQPELTLQAFLEQCRQRVQANLAILLPESSRLKAAMSYSALSGGKRLRAALVYAAAQAVGGIPPRETAIAIDKLACAVELIHAYSLVHDDLPAMDDDNLRRGKPTCHIAFDEATAILAGDALQALAFEIVAGCNLPADLRCRLTVELAQASGADGMVAGQSLDLAAENQSITLTELEAIHHCKTGMLIRASVRFGAWVMGADTSQQAALDNCANAIGLAFQVQDDILDIEGNTKEMGKQQGADIAHNKATYPSLLGLAASKKRADELCRNALEALADFSNQANMLRDIAAYTIKRKS